MRPPHPHHHARARPHARPLAPPLPAGLRAGGPPPPSDALQTGEALRVLADILLGIRRGTADTFIVSHINHLPHTYEDALLPADISPASERALCLHRFFARQTECECRLRDCSVVLRGFRAIVVRCSILQPCNSASWIVA